MDEKELENNQNDENLNDLTLENNKLLEETIDRKSTRLNSSH